ncbi:MAG: YDG domain-containing protein, partial [Clostridia bacterium]
MRKNKELSKLGKHYSLSVLSALRNRILPFILSFVFFITMIPVIPVTATTGTLEMEQSFVSPNTAGAFIISDTNTFNVTFSLTSVDMVNPTLVITVPKGIEVTYYPTSSNATLAPTLISVNPVAKVTDAEGNSVITYKFRTDMTAIGFNITLKPTYRLDETIYTVSAQYSDGETVIDTKQASVTISENPTLSNNIMYFYNSLNTYVYRDGLNDYYAPCNSYVYYSPERNNHYSYDYIEYTVPLPDQAVPGLGQGSSFSPFEAGVSYTIGSGTDAYSVKYYESYNYINASGTTIGTGKALVYTLPDTHAFTAGNSYYSFAQNIYLKISVSEPGEYSKNIRPQIKANAKGTDIVLADYADYSSNLYSNLYYYLIGAQIKVYNISDYLYAYNSYTYSPYVGYYILPVERNTSYISYVYNKTEQTVTDLKVEYTFAKKLYADKIMFNLNSSLTSDYPNTASVRYKTFLGGDTIYEASFNADLKEFQLTDPLDAITWMEVTYNRLPHYQYGTNLMYAYLTNRDEVASTGQITAKIISAQPEVLGPIPTQATTTYTFSLIASFPTRTWQEISPVTLNKGDTFRLNFRLSYDSAEVVNPEYYIIMPSTYIFMGYTPSTVFQNIEYDLSVRDIGDGNTLYSLKYNDNIGRNGQNIGYFSFKVGPAVPTTTVQTRKLPVAVYYQHDGTYYPYRTSYMYTDINDYDGDESTTDQLAYAPDSELTTVTINSVSAMTAQSYLTSDVTEGENTTMQYRYDSAGSYKYYMYNGLQAGNDASDLVIDITVPRKNASFLYNDATYTSRFDAKLTGPVNLTGDLFTNCTVEYKLDGSETYIADASGLWDQVSAIRITTETGRSLTSTNSAVIKVPFSVNGFDSSTTTSHYAYFDTQMHYTLTSTGETVHISRIEPNSLQAAYTNITGTVYKDFNANAVKDANETSRSYSIMLYSGTSAQGSYLRLTYANSSTGFYSLGVICPGTYTLKIAKDSTEYYPAIGSFLFDDQGTYTFTLGYPTTDQISNVNLGIISPRTLNLNFTTVKVLEGTTRNIVPSIDPVLSSSEASISYSSSDESVVTVSSSGVLTYVSDGTATVTVTVPQLSGFAALEGEADTISKTVSVTCEKPGCNITAAPYASLNGTNTPVTSHNIQLTRGVTSSLRFYYIFNRGGYCNAGHTNSKIVTWSVYDAGGTDAVMSSTTTGYYYSYDYEFAYLYVSTPGTVILKATETWPHDSTLKPEDIYVTVNVYGQYDISLPTSTGFTITPYMSSSPVNHNGAYSFAVSLSAGYNQSDITVKSNGTNLTLTDGRYTVSDIIEDKSITIEGVTPNTYTVTLNTNGGTIGSNNVTSYTYGTVSTLPVSSDISRAGYTFNGWTLTESADDISYITSITNTEMGNKQYYAKWTAIPVVSPTSLLAGGATAEYGYSSATIDATVVAADGHTVLGYQWYSCNQDKSNAVAVTGADSDEYSVPFGYDAGTYYYYCTVTIRRTDNSLTQTFDTDVVSFIVGKKALTATASANDKTYDGTALASGNISLSGVLGTDDVSATGTFTFTDVNAGNDINVIVTSIALFGTDANNYTVNTSASGSADIQKALLTATVGNYSKTYGQDNPSFSVSVTGFVNGEN